MVSKSSNRKGKRVIGLDRHRLGLIGGSVGALIVMCLSFFYRETDFYTAIIRSGWGFVICYFAAVVLVHGILRATLLDFAQQRQEAKDAEEADEAAAAKETAVSTPKPTDENLSAE